MRRWRDGWRWHGEESRIGGSADRNTQSYIGWNTTPNCRSAPPPICDSLRLIRASANPHFNSPGSEPQDKRVEVGGSEVENNAKRNVQMAHPGLEVGDAESIET